MYEVRNVTERMTTRLARAILEKMTADQSQLRPRAVNKPLALYGGGNLGRMAKEYLGFLGINVTMVVDVNAERLREDPFWSDVHVVAPGEVPESVRGESLLAVSVANESFGAIAAALAAAGWADIAPFYDLTELHRERHPLSNGWFAPPFRPEDAIEIGMVLGDWADDVSRAHHLQFIAWRRLRQEWLFADAPVTTGDRFFTPEIMAALEPAPRFLDLGAHHGVVTNRLIELRPDFEKAWLIEPDPANVERIKSWRSGGGPRIGSRTEIYELAVASQSGRRFFCAGLGYASQFSPNGSHVVDATTIDRLGLAPTYMKLHLEGWEREALAGAVSTLKRHQPLISATVYHNDDGLWRTARWLMQELPGYDFLFRLHSWCGTGAVIYGIPTIKGEEP